MLNRRVLRVKAIQSLYSYFLLQSSLRDLIEEELVAKYALDPALHDFADRKLFETKQNLIKTYFRNCLLYTSPSPRDRTRSRMPSSA